MSDVKVGSLREGPRLMLCGSRLSSLAAGCDGTDILLTQSGILVPFVFNSV